jgi:hypothetical protein
MPLKGHDDNKKLLTTAPKTYLSKKERKLVEEILGVVAASSGDQEELERSCDVSPPVRVLRAALQKVVNSLLTCQICCFRFHAD